MSSKPYCFKVGETCPRTAEPDPQLVFVLMPFRPKQEFDEVYEKGIRPAWESSGVKLRCLRADEWFHTRDIMCEVCYHIQRARYIVADMTGRNPNVFYELGLAHAFGKRVVLVTQRKDDVPVDLLPMYRVEYDYSAEGLSKLATELGRVAQALVGQAEPSKLAESRSKMPLPGKSFISETDGKEMILIPAGEFIMGSDTGRDDEKPQRKAYLPDFYISRYQVTNAEFEAFVKATGQVTTAEKEGKGRALLGGKWGWVKGADWRHPCGPDSSIAGREKHPVVQVSWSDAVAYCQWAGKRLPTEAEWEKAARGTGGRTWPWGNEWVDGKCNTSEAGVDDTTPVGRYSPASDSPYGVADMAGNVWEWTADWYRAYPGSTYKSDDFGDKRRVVRGGSWSSDQVFARCACRSRVSLDNCSLGLGFRVAE
jgi:formylglycine-generating enzyme required for sulfatase activity